jgi:hypothetical protein
VNNVTIETPREDPQMNTALLSQAIEQSRIRPAETMGLGRSIR